MRAAAVVALLALLAAATPLMGARWIYDPDPKLARDPYRYPARQLAVRQRRRDRAYAAAYWHAAWLAWLAPRRYASSGEGEAFIRDRGNRDRASSDPAAPLAAIYAVDARRLLENSALSGTLAQQSPRLRAEIADLLQRAEQQEAAAARDDPVSRVALAQLGLALDDAIQLQRAGPQDAQRLSVLRAAATRAEAVAAWLPDAPGAHRLLAVIRARLADLSPDDGGSADAAARWELAIAEAERARQLDPSDAYLTELLWTLHLRAGDWKEAAAWKRKLEADAVASTSRAGPGQPAAHRSGR
ncbi:MAG: hypothetical protein ACE149_02980 [Armatimonadota bacterium]